MALLAIHGLVTGTTPPQNLAWLIIGMTFVSASFLAWRKEVAAKEALLKKQEDRDQRIFVESSPAYLIGLAKAGTTLQANALTAMYIGKWLRVAVKVSNVAMDFGGDRPIVTGKSADDITVFLVFSDKWIERIRILGKDNQIVAIGQIDSITNKIWLMDCELQEETHTEETKPIVQKSPTLDP